MMAIETIHLSALRADSTTQSRVKLDNDVIADYAERMKAGDKFPPLDVFYDGHSYWVANGFHRYLAAKEAGVDRFECNVRQGSHRDAVEFSLSANADNGLRRTNEDKRQAVFTCLKDGKWRTLSAGEIARMCKVTQQFVSKIKAECESQGTVFPPVKGKDGKTYKSRDEKSESQVTTVVTSAEQGVSQMAEVTTVVTSAEQDTPQMLVNVKGHMIRLPDSLRHVFTSTAELQKQLAEIQKLLDAAYHSLCSVDAGVMVRKGFTRLEGKEGNEKWKADDFAHAFRRIRLNLPYAPCPQCFGEKCKYCTHRGWVTRLEWDGTCAGSTDEQKIKMVETLHAVPF